MRYLMKYKMLVFLSFLTLCQLNAFGQSKEGTVRIESSAHIDEMVAQKKDYNKTIETLQGYKIQIYSGRRVSAEKSKSDFRNSYGKWTSKLVYETPNYKVWVGSFRSRLEADRALLEVKRKFPNAFIFKPKKEKEN